MIIYHFNLLWSGAPNRGGWGGLQARVQEFARGAAQNFFFFLLFNFPEGGGPAQKRAEKMTFSTKKVAKYRSNSLIFALMTFFFFFFLLFNFLGPPWTRAWSQPPLNFGWGG